ncbi:transposase [Streptomyces sp. NPDC048506]|uniref:transposase n=1 Tax=Streptomyces sp. NPDC048506 TaxID=3155028 RepID=UPI003444FF03
MGDSPERPGSEASLAALCGVGPIEHSSGRHQYRRLNRGRDSIVGRPARAAFRSGVRQLVVISSTAGRDRMRSSSCVPCASRG